MTFTLEQREIKYKDGLLDQRWKKVRGAILSRDQYQCQCCGKKDSLHVHHRQYQRDKVTGMWKEPWDYDFRLLITLCQSCHHLGHKQYSIPIKEVSK